MADRVTLKVSAGPLAGRVFSYDRHDTFLFGRSPDCHAELAATDTTASRHHFLLEVNPPHARLREIMGATDPAKAAPGTIRRDLASSIEANCIHGSDAPETARFEIAYFFPGIELVRSER